MSYPEVNQIKVEAMNAFVSIKSSVNSLKNLIVVSASEPMKLLEFKDSATSTVAEKAEISVALSSLANIHNAIIAEGF